jgi:ribose-phosphate pyrophosphokinase
LKIIDSDYWARDGVFTMFFPGGEPHLKIKKFDDGMPLLHVKARDWTTTTFAALVANALDIQFIETPARVQIFMPYFPAARQDRSDGLAPRTLRFVADMFSRFEVYMFDVHSRVTRIELGLSDTPNSGRYFMMPEHIEGLSFPDVVGVIAPDEGAQVRASRFMHRLCPNAATFVQCTKVRDSHSGKLHSYHMPPLTKPGKYIIVDDICDGGGTFNLLAEAWKRDPMSKDCQLDMWVSHGIFSKGLNAIDPVIRQIWTTDSWCDARQMSERLTVVPLLPHFLKFAGFPNA